MAKDFEARKDAGAAGKVVGSADVRKRKVSSKERAARAAQAAQNAQAQAAAGEQPAPGAAEEPKRRRVERTKFTEDALRAAAGEPAADAAGQGAGDVPAEPADSAPDADAAAGARAGERRSIRDDLKVIRGAKPVPAAPENTPDAAEAQGGTAQQEGVQQVDADAEVGDAAAQDAADGDGQSRPTRRKVADKPQRLWPKVVVGVIAAIVLVAAIVSAVFVWNRSYRYDDVADFQGTWYAQGTAVPIAVDAGYLYMNDEVKYAYALDTGAKTIEYTFGPYSGQGRYWFSADRQHLVIEDGEGFSAATTFLQDARRAFDEFLAGSPRPLPSGEGATVLSRTPASSESMSMGVTDDAAVEGAASADPGEPAGGDADSAGVEAPDVVVPAEGAAPDGATDDAADDPAADDESAGDAADDGPAPAEAS